MGVRCRGGEEKLIIIQWRGYKYKLSLLLLLLLLLMMLLLIAVPRA